MPNGVELNQLAPDREHKSDRMNRTEVCDMMGWTQQELTMSINQDGFPCKSNMFSRSAIKAWEKGQYGFEYHYMPKAS